MVRHVFSIALAKHEVFNPIVRFNAIDVMNNLVWLKITTKMFFHDKAMFADIADVVRKGMVSNFDKCVSASMRNPAFPDRSVLSYWRVCNIARSA
jgi:hypothetical protein